MNLFDVFGARRDESRFRDGKNYTGIKLALYLVLRAVGTGAQRTQRYATVPVHVCVIDEE